MGLRCKCQDQTQTGLRVGEDPDDARSRRRSSSLYRSSMFVDFIRRGDVPWATDTPSASPRHDPRPIPLACQTLSHRPNGLPRHPVPHTSLPRHAHSPTTVSNPPDTRDQHSGTVCLWHCAENGRSTVATARSATLSRSHASIPHDCPRPHTRLPAGHVPSDATGIPSTTPRFPGSPLPPPAPDATLAVNPDGNLHCPGTHRALLSHLLIRASSNTYGYDSASRRSANAFRDASSFDTMAEIVAGENS